MASSPSAWSRYRPAVLVITSISACYATYAIYTHVFCNSTSRPDSPLHRSNAVRHRNGSRPTRRVGAIREEQNDVGGIQATEPRHDTVADDDSQYSRHNGRTGLDENDHNVMQLLYHISEEKSRKENYVHRGVQCNSCGAMPIQGIRFQCANCKDYDLCETCEAQQNHIKTHVFIKIRIPAPCAGHARQPIPVWYPGRPQEIIPRAVPQELRDSLLNATNMEHNALEALFDQFKCIAGRKWPDDPHHIHMAIDREIFDKCFIPHSPRRLHPPNLIHDRLFAFFDTNQDGMIDFPEFVKGIAALQDTTRDATLRRIFRGYDIDDDGFVDRKDFLRMFRAFYMFTKEMQGAMFQAMEEDAAELEDDDVESLLRGSRPLSSAFAGMPPREDSTPAPRGKRIDRFGDHVISDNQAVLNDDRQDIGDRQQAIVEAAVDRIALGTHIPQHPDDLGRIPSDEDLPGQPLGWPPMGEIQAADTRRALGRDVPLDEIMDPIDRARVIFAQTERITWEVPVRAEHERWRRRAFYIDEEEGAEPPLGYTEEDSSDDDDQNGVISPGSGSDSRRPSLRSRSSSKVRFEDHVMETDYETRSNTSSKGIPTGERWGGHEIPEAERDVGKEILYQAVSEGMNELLDQLFKPKEDLAMAAKETKAERDMWKDVIAAAAARQAGRAMQDGAHGESAHPAEEAPEKDPTTEDAPQEFTDFSIPDPTLPQNRPNTPPPTPPPTPASPSTSRTARLAALNTLSPSKSSTTSSDPSRHLSDPDPRPLGMPTPEQITTYILHNRVDEEAKLRRGYGKLSFEEWSERMVPERDLDGGGVKEEGDDGKAKSASLGKLGFVGMWLDVCGF